MRLAVAMLALALGVLGCAPAALLTGVPPGFPTDGEPACFTNSAHGRLVADPTYGTAVVDTDGNPANTVAVPVMWRPGFSARRAGGEIEVMDPAGNVVATTGRVYRIDGGYVGEDPLVFWACDRVTEG
jgi:hypothetical protein